MKNLYPKLPRGLIFTLLSLASLKARAADIVLRAGSRVLVATVRASDAEVSALKPADLIDLLRTAELREIAVQAEHPSRPGIDWPSWTEPRQPLPTSDIGWWTESKTAPREAVSGDKL